MSEIEKKFGEALRIERERRGLTLEEVSVQLKISEENLAFLESGDKSGLPSDLYFHMFLRTYSEALGIHYQNTLDAIRQETSEPADSKPAEHHPDSVDDSEQEDASSVQSGYLKKLLYALGGLVVVFAAFIIVAKLWWNDNGPSETDSGSEGQAATSERVKMESALAAYNWGQAEDGLPEPMILRLTPREESWSTVLADGDTAIFRILRVGRVYTAEAKYRLQISVGIPSVVDLELNGVPVDLTDPETRRISRVRIDQVTLPEFLANRGVRPNPSVEENNPDSEAG